jgi:hypothetical protein
VAIYRILQNSAFRPEEIARMGIAYERALVMLRLKSRDDPVSEKVAKLVIEVAKTGVTDPEMICALALRRLNDKRNRSVG